MDPQLNEIVQNFSTQPNNRTFEQIKFIRNYLLENTKICVFYKL